MFDLRCPVCGVLMTCVKRTNTNVTERKPWANGIAIEFAEHDHRETYECPTLCGEFTFSGRNLGPTIERQRQIERGAV